MPGAIQRFSENMSILWLMKSKKLVSSLFYLSFSGIPSNKYVGVKERSCVRCLYATGWRSYNTVIFYLKHLIWSYRH